MLDSIITEEQLIDRAYELGLPAVAITDHESVSGHIKALNYYNKKYADKKDHFKLILGNEIYLTRSGLNADTHQKGEKFYHLLLLAKDKIGHRQLRELSSRAWSRSYFRNLMRVPTFIEDLIEVVQSNPGHLIATTACLGGYTGTMFMMNELAAIEPFLESMTAIFGRSNFFIELQPSKTGDQLEYNKHMIINFWDNYNFIFTTDSHYLKQDDAEVHKWFLQSRSGAREVDEYYTTAYMMDWEELKSFFSFYVSPAKIEVMRQNTLKIASMVTDYSLDRGQIVPKIQYDKQFDQAKEQVIRNLFATQDLSKYPYIEYFLSPENEADNYFMKLVLEGYYDKIYTIKNHRKEVSLQERMERINIELQQIRRTSLKIDQSLSDYFNTMAKMIEIIWNEGDSIVGPGRGSASGFLVNYLVGITQIDPQTQELPLPYWRFIHESRPGLPDIDIDSEATKRVKIFNKIREYFNSIGSDVINVCTFGTEGSKSAIRTAGRALDIDDNTISYLTSMIPNERGIDLSLKQCYYGDETHNPIREFVNEMDKNPNLKKLTFAIEGLITRLGAHAAGILILEGSPADHNSIMKTSRGIVVSAFNLEDSEQMGGLKYDMLTVAALDKIHTTINYLLEDRVIEWQGSLRATYDKYLLPAVLDYDSFAMWKKLWDGEVTDAFQFDTMVGSQAIRLIKPNNIKELAIANSIMRLMAQDQLELPLDTFIKHKKNINDWYHEMRLYGLGPSEIAILEPHLLPLFGIADSQEAAMQLVMDDKIAGFDLTEANSLRKAIARKDHEVLENTKAMFFEKGNELGSNKYMLDYVWNVQVMRQAGYAFSILHTMAYSTITLQQMNLVHKFNPIYWKTACLSVNAGAINEEDYYNLVNEGVIELSDEDDLRSNTKIQYGKVASAIGAMRGSIEVKQPNINKSRMGFTPDAEKNIILYGLKGITRVGDAIIQNIILNRPYTSVNDFVEKMLTPEGKKLISKDKVVNLIKAGAFDDVENKPRKEILFNYIKTIADAKNNLTLSNFLMLMRKNLVPEHLSEEQKCYNFTRYIRKSRYKNLYLIDEIALDYLLERFPEDRIQSIITDEGVETNAIPQNWWDQIYNSFMNNVRDWIKQNKETLLESLNAALFTEEYEKYASGTILDWELESLNFFYSGHPLDNVSIPLQISKYNDIIEDEVVGFFHIKGKTIPRLRLHTIVGTVINKDKQKGIVTLAAPDAVIDVKFYRQLFALYSHEDDDILLSTEEQENSTINEDFFKKGTHLAITGIKRGDMFLPKVYKNTGIQAVLKIEVDPETNEFLGFKAKE